MDSTEHDLWCMNRALQLATRGQGLVEPNPMVGCVIVNQGEIVGEGWHQRFGSAHAEVNAIKIAGRKAVGATMYVTLEPCCHEGKTPPCTLAIIDSGIRRVVAAQRDPFPLVDGNGLAELKQAGIEVEVGLFEEEARDLNAPFLKLVQHDCPWIMAKWAMTLDGKIATKTGDSQWISGEASRRVVHELRGRVDAIIVGRGTAAADNPMLTARPPGSRVALRVVVDSKASLSSDHQLVTTAQSVPTLVMVSSEAKGEDCTRLAKKGIEVFLCTGKTREDRITELLVELAGRRMTNVLVEGGGGLLGSLFDMGLVDEIHTFIAPKIIGGEEAITPVSGLGINTVAEAMNLSHTEIQQLGDDIYLKGRILRSQQ